MGNDEFLKIAVEEVRRYTNENLEDPQGYDVYVVWVCKTLQNNKALLSTTLPDGMYFEVTYNGDKKELYFDAYHKLENRCIKAEG
jgi:3'-phosphoadenosine 5'-phosphosulfate sulfotransferase